MSNDIQEIKDKIPPALWDKNPKNYCVTSV